MSISDHRLQVQRRPIFIPILVYRILMKIFNLAVLISKEILHILLKLFFMSLHLLL